MTEALVETGWQGERRTANRKGRDAKGGRAVSCVFFALVCAFCSACLSSCTFFNANIEDLMHPPQLTQEQREITAALEAALGEGGYELKYPQNGGYSSTVLFQDMDGDGGDEAIVFFLAAVKGENIRVGILDRAQEGWQLVCEAGGLGSTVEEVAFVRFFEGEPANLVVGWGNGTVTDTLAVYDYSPTAQLLDSLYTGGSASMLKYQPAGTQKENLVLFTQNVANQETTVRMLTGRGVASIRDTGGIALNGEVKSVEQAVTGRILADREALFVDERRVSGQLATQVFFIDGERLTEGFAEAVSGLETEEIASNPELLRWDETYCEDVNDDGIVELPLEVALPDAEESRTEGQIYLTKHLQYGQDGFRIVQTAVFNHQEGYKVILPDSWIGRVTVELRSSTREWRFYRYEEGEDGTQPRQEELLRIRVYAIDEYQDKFDTGDYRKLASRGANEFFAYIPPYETGDMAITYEQCAWMFRLL